ncbi:hypothetical protein [Mucilaginibacter agri]|uniref:MG2 domain-containing protein n=1 Tax=Mucilaginibacter agri TaxID=2695265 RepID=A0A965ZF69_9SPHI|nr:hypothetical protein [Mucilaginibacter agri]NCD68982.1 hypothetical protein [Mucilaginibacter agri]
MRKSLEILRFRLIYCFQAQHIYKAKAATKPKSTLYISFINICVLIIFLGTYCTPAFCQSRFLRSELKELSIRSDSLNNLTPTEKLYLQLDKPYYALGDTIWFKAYLLNADLLPSNKSRIINLDIANDSNKVIKHYRFAVANGISYGNISLNEKDGFTSGTYTIRSYTNWMRNFGDSYFFYKSFYVANALENKWLVNSKVNTSAINGISTADVKLQLRDIYNRPVIAEDLQIRGINEYKDLFNQKYQTVPNGELDVKFAIPQKINGLAIIAESKKVKNRSVIPVILNRVENIDVQFLPEGGNLVAGLPAHIGFKAIGEDGKGVEISGMVIDNDQRHVASFKTLHKGIGSFYFDIKPGQRYVAKVNLPGGIIKDYLLPAIKNSGTVLSIKNLLNSDSLDVIVSATNDLMQTGNSYFLTANARGVICYAAVVSFNNEEHRIKIAKSLFPSGIVHFTLLTTTKQPLNERQVFIDHHDDLNISFVGDKPEYISRDSVALYIKVSDHDGKPVSGNFSLAVTDDAQIKIDTLNCENILTRMMLTSDLKGHVENPLYYFNSKTTESWQALDNLLLTQGWIGYDWQQVLAPPPINYQPETEFTVKGGVYNFFNKPVRGTNVLLLSKSPAILMETNTDKDGKFIFNNFPRVDTAVFVLKAVNKNGKSFNVGIKMDDNADPALTQTNSPLITPWYVNSDTTLLNYIRNSELAEQQRDLPHSGQLLKEVKITAKKIVNDSENLNGPGNADVVLDEKDLEAAGKKNWLQLLQENIKGFREGASNTSEHKTVHEGGLARDIVVNKTSISYFAGYKKIVFIVDGMQLDSVLSLETLADYRNFFTSHDAEDIKGIEVIVSGKYTSNYLRRFVISETIYEPWKLDYAFVEITTRSRSGPFFSYTPGLYLYKPVSISWPKQFYKPKYSIKDPARQLNDLRSTIDWEPFITTDNTGEAVVSFYTGDRSANYTLIIEGIDRNGNLGYRIGKMSVTKPKEIN